jgi:hypothetical protein
MDEMIGNAASRDLARSISISWSLEGAMTTPQVLGVCAHALLLLLCPLVPLQRGATRRHPS